MNNLKTIKGRKTELNHSGRFDNLLNVIELEQGSMPKTTVANSDLSTSDVKTIFNPMVDQDRVSVYSMNPYKASEPARDANPNWGFGPGLEAGSHVVINENAAELLRKRLSSASWKVAPIVLSGNLDCYHALEEKLELTRSMLEVLWEFRHPVKITTKNALILRDLDILKKLASHNLVKVVVSLSTLDDRLRQKMDPDTSSVFSRLRTVKHLASVGIPVSVIAAPIIPGLNDHEVMSLVRTVASHGADDITHIVFRLNKENEFGFRGWLQSNYPSKYDKVMKQLASLHKGKARSNTPGQLRVGAGGFADSIRDQMRLAKRVYFNEISKVELDTELFESTKSPQLTLFG